ncbi:MAG: ribonuclease J [Oscillospiraceae bacterium]|nr:ribonuclease J [Oscillospiraceae bacterium]
MQQEEKKEVLDASVRGKKPYSRQEAGSRRQEAGGHAPAARQKPPAQPGQRPAQPQGGPQKKQQARPKKAPKPPLRIAFLGGLNEVGKNITCYEFKGERILVDCGLAFPDAETPGIDLIIPDFSWLEQNADTVKGIVITHGHEDHIGGLPYLLKKLSIPVFASKLTIGLIKGKLREHRMLDRVRLHEIKPGDTMLLGGFLVEAIHVNHSIPDAMALAITCEAGTVIQTGDFKIDTTPIDGEMIDLARFARFGKKGVLALLSDSTNAERPGYTMSERKVGESFETLFRKAGGRRLLVATFSSNVHRIQQIIDVAAQLGRKVALLGRSLENVVGVGTELGYLHIPDGVLIPADMINRYAHDQLVIITTGSQGEPMSALTRMAFSDHRKVDITPQDCVIISATPIPGNEKTVGRVVNELLKLGAQVVYEKMYDVHVSGHACQEELKIMLGLTRPKFFIPVHGEQKHLTKHANLAMSMGMNPNHIIIADNGIQLELTADELKVGDPVPAGSVYVDGYGVGDVGSAVLRDRKHLAQEGMVIVSVCMDQATGQLVSGPEIVSKGFVYVKESEDLLQEAREVAQRVIDETPARARRDWNTLRGRLREDVSRLMYERTKRSPIVLPVVLVS